MFRRILLNCLALSLLAGNVLAQNELTKQSSQTPPPAVTAAISKGDSIRVTSPGEVTQIRLEVYSANGEMVFDSGMRPGNIINWKVADATLPIADGSYLIAITTKDLHNKLRQKLGNLSLQAGQLSLNRREQPTPPQTQIIASRRQSQKIDPSDADDSITIVTEGKERSVVLTAHDGQQGQVTSTKGALTLNTGDTLTGQDKEQMRITPEGFVGIGTNKPEATLDVAGSIRARGGIRFDDGTTLTSAKVFSPAALGTKTTAVGTEAANVIGTGTANTLPKWSDNAGGLGDSIITEGSGKIGIGTSNPTNRFHVVGGNLFHQFGTNQGNEFGFYTAINNNHFTSNLAYDGQWRMMSPGKGSGFAVAPFSDVAFSVFMDNTPRAAGAVPVLDSNFVIKMNGFVGMGTVTPSERLEVTGNLKLSGASNGIIFPDGTKQTTASAGLNGANVWTGVNNFSSGLSVNNALITNVGNPVNAGDAVNKAYVDAGFIKFVPGAEQLSVGDANGTAPMINLRGGSTCCNGPGGHTPAWFKVFQNGSFVATGNLGIGVPPIQGRGYRTSWDSYKGAFRSGYADNEWDDANVGFFSWAGGSNSTAIGLYALAFGDTNSAESTSSIVFGSGNQVKGAAGFSAGAGNRVCDTYGVALGNNAKSGGPLINGRCDPDTFNIRGLAAVAIGYNVTADQDHTTAMGKFASNNGWAGTFIWSDGSAMASADTFRNTANNEFAARASGGFRFRTNLGGTTGCNLPAGSGVFNCTSSRYTKENFSMANGEDILSRLRKVPVSTWNYISEGHDVRHMGPMAEDFFDAFKLGTGNNSIGVQDLAGVSLGAIKALDQRTSELQQKTAEVAQLQQQVNQLRESNNAMERRLAALEQQLQKLDSRDEKRD